MTLLFASNNEHKITEVKQLLGNLYAVKSLKEIGCLHDIPETGATLEENARIKAQYVFQKYGISCFSDDSGLEVDALNGAPGVHSARYAGEEKSDAKNIQKLLASLQGIAQRKAQFKTVICLIIDGKEHLFEGIVRGEITTEAQGEKGFGYDPVFVPLGSQKTFAALSASEKNEVSHRSIAIKKLANYLLT